MDKRALGNRNKLKTKKWLEAQGWQVWNSEVGKTVFFGGKLRIIRQDLVGSDLLCMNGKDIIFVQCKSRKDDIPEAIREFRKYPFPPFVKLWVVRWELRNKMPIIKELSMNYNEIPKK